MTQLPQNLHKHKVAFSVYVEQSEQGGTSTEDLFVVDFRSLVTALGPFMSMRIIKSFPGKCPLRFNLMRDISYRTSGFGVGPTHRIKDARNFVNDMKGSKISNNSPRNRNSQISVSAFYSDHYPLATIKMTFIRYYRYCSPN